MLSAQTALAADVAARINAAYPRLETLYKHFHANPELSLQEARTAARLADELAALGYAVTRGVGGHGVVAVLPNGDGPTLLLRTDMDALPVIEQTGAPYASTVTGTGDGGETVGVMHACGHDMHMSVFLGAAEVLAGMRAHWRGTLVLIGQPAEETVQGARAMLADGLYERFPRPDTCLALHVAPDMPAGMVGITDGHALANTDSVDIIVRGVSGHGAWPHRTKDPVVLAAQIVLALQTIVSREIDPTEPAVVTVGSIHGGTKHNIIPDEVHLQLTVRSYADEVRAQTLAAIRRITQKLAEAAGMPEDRYPVVSVSDRGVPSTYNDPELAARLRALFGQWLGPDQVLRTKPIMGAEDFGLYSRAYAGIAGCMLWLGTVDPERFAAHARDGRPLPPLHSSAFLPEIEPTMRTGITALSAAVLDLLAP
jgi:hippurate hydrolase